jgi:hypothetical protein
MMEKKDPDGCKAGPAMSEYSRERDAYSKSDIQQLAKAIGVSSFTPEVAYLLQLAAKCYQLQSILDRDPSRSERRKNLSQVARDARALASSLETLSAVTDQALDNCRVYGDDLVALAESAEQAATRIPRGGGDPKHARRHFVEKLTHIFSIVAGKRPARRYDASKGGEYGQFADFVRAALRPLKPRAVQGVESDIKAAVAVWKNSMRKAPGS